MIGHNKKRKTAQVKFPPKSSFGPNGNSLFLVFFPRHWRLTGQQGKGRGPLLFHSTTSNHSRTFRHLFSTLHVRWLSHIFNRTACIYQSATRWNLPPYWITFDVDFCLFTWWFVTGIWHGTPLDSNAHRLSLLYYRRTD